MNVRHSILFLILSFLTTNRPTLGQLANCGINGHYSDCGTRCPLTCDNYKQPPYCGDDCLPGCFCNVGFVQHPTRGCIRRSECQSLPSTTTDLPTSLSISSEKPTSDPPETESKVKCPTNETYNDCFNECGRRCRDLAKRPNCLSDCGSGCTCKTGFYRNSEDQCVQKDDCPASDVNRLDKEQLDPRCPPGQKYFKCSECEAACPHWPRRWGRPDPIPLMDRVKREDDDDNLVRDKRMILPPRWPRRSSGKCLVPSQCDELTPL